MNFRNPVVAVWTFVIFTTIGISFAIHFHLEDLLYDPGMPLSHRLLYELAGAWSAMVLMPALNWVTLRFPITRATLIRVLAIDVVIAYPIYTLAHTTINALLRFTMAPLFGVHDETFFNYLRETPAQAANDFAYFGMLLATLYLINRFIETQEISKKLAEARLENLRLQLQPHFLFNTLNAISAVMYEDVGKADRMLAQVSEFMRVVLDSGGVQSVSLDEELRIERMYVDIMKTRLERSLGLDVRVDDEARDALVPFMLLQPLLENSIRHGMGSARSTIDLEIDVRRNNGSTIISVADDGLGYDRGAPEGIGLSNVTTRLHYMYGEKASFSIAPRDGGGTLAILTLPYIKGSDV